jgi:hypothetical protein
MLVQLQARTREKKLKQCKVVIPFCIIEIMKVTSLLWFLNKWCCYTFVFVCHILCRIIVESSV